MMCTDPVPSFELRLAWRSPPPPTLAGRPSQLWPPGGQRLPPCQVPEPSAGKTSRRSTVGAPYWMDALPACLLTLTRGALQTQSQNTHQPGCILWRGDGLREPRHGDRPLLWGPVRQPGPWVALRRVPSSSYISFILILTPATHAGPHHRWGPVHHAPLLGLRGLLHLRPPLLLRRPHEGT